MERKGWEEIRREARPKVRYWVPGAAMDEADLKKELRLLKERGFGGVEVVALLGTPEEIVKGEDGWGTPNWERMVQVIADTTEELGMTFDLANGPLWPISMPTVSSADDPAAARELTWGSLVLAGNHYEGPLPERQRIHAEGTAKLVHVMAYQKNSEGKLLAHTYRDLSGGVGEQGLCVTLPEAEEGNQWVLFAFYCQPTAQKTGAGSFYVIDHLSKAGAKACAAYWEPILETHAYPSLESLFCDSLEYEASLDWTEAFPQEFERRRGYSILPYLPFLGMKEIYPFCDVTGYALSDAEISWMVNQDYCEVLTQCYCENHLEVLENMAERYGKNVRYQVAYNKAFEVERSALFVGIPENEALGRPSIDGQKTMAAAVHLGRKKRYSFECAAEFGNCYGQDYEDLFWWVKRSLMAGMNAQVLHGASYSGGYHGKYSRDGGMDGVSWPGYEAFSTLVSNNWNRTLSVQDARGCLDAVARLNAIFQKQAKVDCAVYRASYLNDGAWSEQDLYPDGGALNRRGYSYEFVSEALLELPQAVVADGILDPEGVGYRCLLIPEQEAISSAFLVRARTLADAGLMLVWAGKKPKMAQYYAEWNTQEKQNRWKALLEEAWERAAHVERLEEIPDFLEKQGIFPRLELRGEMDLTTAVRTEEEMQRIFYAVYAYNQVKYCPESPNPEELAVSAVFQKGTVKSTYVRPGAGSARRVRVRLEGIGQVYRWNFWDGSVSPLPFREKDGRMEGELVLEEDDFVLLALERKEPPAQKIQAKKRTERQIPVRFERVVLEEFRAEGKTFLKSGFSGEKRAYALTELCPWKELDSSLEHFVGRGTYEGTVFCGKIPEEGRAVLTLGNVCDTFRVWVNGAETAFPDQVRKEADVTAWLREGENQIQVLVTSNLYNRRLAEPQDLGIPLKIPYNPKNYGIWETEGKPCVLKWIEE
ncbi:MAG: glycosyl hydrolase [Eubacteriales bacterium]|nr:glycosyl hydrolase [Eubacteriales bacterium]